jgi:hypothetical protein
MKKLLLFMFVAAFSLTQLLAQESTFEKGDKVLNIGLGFGNSYYGSLYTSHPPAFAASFEVGVADNIIDKGSFGVGGIVSFSTAKYTDYYKTTNIIIGARGILHYPFVDKLDTYTGLMLGYNFFKYTYYDLYTGADISSNTAEFAWFVGARYYFTESFAVMGELGFGTTIFNVGVAFKF